MADVRSVSLDPPSASVALRAYVVGMLPIEGVFTRFHGWLRFDPAQPKECAVELAIEATSLAMPDPAMREEVLSPAFLDATVFPTLAYRGQCTGSGVAGALRLHGLTRPFSLALAAEGGRLVATGTIDRTEWGMTGRPFAVGRSVRIQVSLPMPTGFRLALAQLSGLDRTR